MVFSFLYIIFAILALSFLIFIHELGHYFMARRVGMHVETFSIGFGKPIFSWEYQGVKWQIGWILFGGYVKIAGHDLDKDKDPYSIPNSFFSKSPFDRIKVAFMGPFVNLVFAMLIFSLLWVEGGRQKSYSEYTSKIGWVDPKSELYMHGVRPGDEILSYDAQAFQSSKDHLYAPMMADKKIEVRGLKVSYNKDQKTPFDYHVSTYTHPAALEKDILTAGILQPANYILYEKLPGDKENLLPEGSPLQASGIQYDDRILWVDGEIIFSSMQLSQLLNDGRVLMTIERDGKRLLARVPRVPIKELRLDMSTKDEITDWQYATQLNQEKLQNLYFIPYSINHQGLIEGQIKFIDKEKEDEAFPKFPFSSLEQPLQAEDKIIAVHNQPINNGAELLSQLQNNSVTIIVQRAPQLKQPLSWKQADQAFDQQINWNRLQKMVDSIGTPNPLHQAGDLVLLNPVVPKTRNQIFNTAEKQAWLNAETINEKKEVEAIDDPETRARAMHLLAAREKELMLGLPGVQDRKVDYNPIPTEMFVNVFDQIWHTLGALVTGTLNPKWLSGPIGIVQVVHDSWMVSLRDALFWIGAISLNLGILNLLPIPVLDGGTIVMSFVEMITGRKMSPKFLERLVLPFALLLIGLFIYLTFHDISRILSQFWK